MYETLGTKPRADPLLGSFPIVLPTSCQVVGERTQRCLPGDGNRHILGSARHPRTDSVPLNEEEGWIVRPGCPKAAPWEFRTLPSLLLCPFLGWDLGLGCFLCALGHLWPAWGKYTWLAELWFVGPRERSRRGSVCLTRRHGSDTGPLAHGSFSRS